MNARKNFLLRVSKKTLYLMTIALVAVSALGLFLLSKSNTVSAQQDVRSASKTATSGMLTLALNFGSAADYTVFADKGIAESDSRVGGKTGVGLSDARAKEDLSKAFAVLENLPCTESNQEMRAGKFTAGVYCSKTGDLKGQFVLDGAGDANAIFVFRSEGKMRGSRELNVTLVNGAAAQNVFFVSGDTAEFDGVALNGNVIARNTIKVTDGATVGRAMSVDGKVDVKGATIEGATGVLQICKTAVGEGLNDRIFRFQIGGQVFLVPVGSCSGPITLPAGPVVIDELIDGPVIPTGTFSGRFRLLAVITDPADALIDENLPIRRVTVNVRPGTIQNQTVVEFINVFAVNAIVEICKFPAFDVGPTGTGVIPRSDTAAAQGDANIRDRDVVVGTPFEFTINVLEDTVITVPVGGCSPAIQVNVPTTPGPVPAPAEIFITELGQVDANGNTIYRLEGDPGSLAASTFPANRLNTIDFNVGLDNSNIFGIPPFFNPGGGVVGVDVLEGGVANQTTVNFWNRSEPGFVKICKVAGFGIPVGTRFAFDVWGREPSNTARTEFDAQVPPTATDDFPATIPFPGAILPGVDTVRRVTVPAGPGPLGFCEFVRFGSPDATGGRVQYIAGSQVLVQEVGLAGDPRAVPIDPIPLNNQPFTIPPGFPGGVPCTSPTAPTNPCPNPALQTDPATGVRVGNIRLNAGASAFVSPSTINNTLIPAGICTTAQGNATTNAAGSVTLNPNPSLGCRAAIFRARRGTVEVEFTDFLFRPVLLKVCKTSGPGGATGSVTVTATVSTAGGAFPAVSIAPLTVPVGGCAFLQGPFTATSTVPPVGTFAFGMDVTLTEGAVAGVNVTGFNVLAGSLSPAVTPNPNLGARQGTVRLTATTVAGGIAINEVEFVNAAAPAPVARAFDFDGDGKSDFGAFRPSTSTWHILRSSAGYFGLQFGISSDTIVAADYDGDSKSDIAVFRSGAWYLLRSRDGFSAVNFGSPGDIPQAADFDGDGKADVAVFRPSNGTWYILGSRNGFMAQQFGANGDKAVAADYDGDGKADVAVYRAGAWYINRSTNGFMAINFGIATDKPVQADYDGDKIADVAVYRGGSWYILRSRDGFVGVGFGIESDIPVPADYNGDGRTDIAVYRDGTWHVLDSGTAEAGYRAVQFGAATDMPVPYR